MSFIVKNNLMNLVANDAVAYKIAYAFIDGDENKFTVFQRSFQEQQQNAVVESKASAATEVAKARWAVMYPEEV